MRFRMTEGMVFVPGPAFGAEPSVLRDQLRSIERAAANAPLDDATRSALRSVLRADHVEAVAIGPYDDASTSVPTPQEIAAAGSMDLGSPVVKAGRAVALFSDLLGAPPRLVDGVYIWADAAAGLRSSGIAW